MERQSKQREKRICSRLTNKKGHRDKADRNATSTIMTMRIPLTKNRNATIVSEYAPTMANSVENKETFYSQLKGTLRNIPSTDKLLLIGNFNERIGRENHKWP